MDPLLRNIINNDYIEGLLIPYNQLEVAEIKVLAYADDVTIVCRNLDLQPIFEEYERLTAVSGLALNADKTEVFNLTPSLVTHSRIRYLGTEYCLGRVDQMVVCGMSLASEDALAYQYNVIRRIGIMENIINSWGRRHLTINGRMILAKTFLLSQIVFPAQFVTINKPEVKKIERLIYAFVNGARNLYGPERIARKYLKADRTDGGINGVDIQSFISAIALRQFGKALQLHRTLKSIQSSVSAHRDDISLFAISQLKSSMTNFIRMNLIPDIQTMELISSAPLNLFLNPVSDAARIATQLNIADLHSLQRELIRDVVPRRRLNCVI